jgi:O-antigen ligase
VLFRAGSKGPFLAALGVFVVWILGLSKSVYKSLFFLFASVLIGYLMFDFFTEFMKNISPILYERVFETDDLLSERDILYHYALDVFYRNPLTGGSFGIYLNPGESIYAHNILLDSLMQMGLIGAVMMIYILISIVKRIFQIIFFKENYYWIGLLLMQAIMLLMVSGSVYTEPTFSIFIVLLFMPTLNDNYSLDEKCQSVDQP